MSTNTPKLWLPVALICACAILLAVVALTAVVSTAWPDVARLQSELTSHHEALRTGSVGDIASQTKELVALRDAAVMKLAVTSTLVFLLTSVGFGLALWTIRRIAAGIETSLLPLRAPHEMRPASTSMFASRIAPVLAANRAAFVDQHEAICRAEDKLTTAKAEKMAADAALHTAQTQLSNLAAALKKVHGGDQTLQIAPDAAPFGLPELVNRLLKDAFEPTSLEPAVDVDALIAEVEAKSAKRLEHKRAQDAAMVAEFSKLFAALQKGNFAVRVKGEGKSAAHAKLGAAFNACAAAIDQRLKRVHSAMSETAAPSELNGIFAEICEAHLNTAGRLNEIIDQLQTCSTAITQNSREMKQSTEDLSSRQHSQVTTLEECSAAMSDLSANGKANAQLADEGRALVQTLNEAAQKGKSVVADTIAEMDKIDEEARKISEITRTIDELSFQTNLLSLNAAVEAARAGDAGRGFAVVATEVRSLAGRSADASKEIAELLENSTKNVGTGVEMVKKSSLALAEIEAAAQKVSDLVERNAGSGAEQAQHIEEINISVHDLDTAIQENAKLITRNFAASESISATGETLSDLLMFFSRSGQETPSNPLEQRCSG